MTGHELLLEMSSRLWDRTQRSCVIRIMTVESAGFSLDYHAIPLYPVPSWVKKVPGRKVEFSDTHCCQFPTEQIIDAENFNFAPNFPPNGGCPAPNVCDFERKFSHERKIFQQAKIVGAITLSPLHDAIDYTYSMVCIYFMIWLVY